MISDNTRGAVFMTASMAGFALNDGLMKLAFETMPLAQSVFMRSLFASMALGLLAWHSGALAFRPTREEARALALRCAAEVGATATFLTALAHLPIADATAVLQAAPLTVTMAAALFLAEPVGWRRWSAIGVGFIGMLVMVRPGGAGFSPWMLLPVVTVCFITLRDLVTRRMSAATPTLFASTLTAVTITVLAGAVTPLQGWRPMDGTVLALYAGSAAFIAFAYVANVSSMRIGDVAAVAPFRYTVLVFALILGFVLFADVPDGATLVGAAIVVSAGLYTLWRETKVGRTHVAARSTAHTYDAAGAPRR